MSMTSDAILTQDALSLKNLDKLSVKWVLEWNVEELMKTLQEFMDLKKKINEWDNFYNFNRPHKSKGALTPYKIYRAK